MATSASKVLAQALELTPAERLELARELITSVDPEQSPESWKWSNDRRGAVCCRTSGAHGARSCRVH